MVRPQMRQKQRAVTRAQPIAVGPGQPPAPPVVARRLPLARFGEPQGRLRERRIDVEGGTEALGRRIPAALAQRGLAVEIGTHGGQRQLGEVGESLPFPRLRRPAARRRGGSRARPGFGAAPPHSPGRRSHRWRSRASRR